MHPDYLSSRSRRAHHRPPQFIYDARAEDARRQNQGCNETVGDAPMRLSRPIRIWSGARARLLPFCCSSRFAGEKAQMARKCRRMALARGDESPARVAGIFRRRNCARSLRLIPFMPAESARAFRGSRLLRRMMRRFSTKDDGLLF